MNTVSIDVALTVKAKILKNVKVLLAQNVLVLVLSGHVEKKESEMLWRREKKIEMIKRFMLLQCKRSWPWLDKTSEINIMDRMIKLRLEQITDRQTDKQTY